jgi:hypothetical protein
VSVRALQTQAQAEFSCVISNKRGRNVSNTNSINRNHDLTVASAAFPKYDRNLNTGGDNERDTRYIVVRQRILHDRAHPSFVRLPIIPR